MVVSLFGVRQEEIGNPMIIELNLAHSPSVRKKRRTPVVGEAQAGRTPDDGPFHSLGANGQAVKRSTLVVV